MIEDNAKEFGCKYCGAPIPKRLVRKSKLKKESITCELCGEKTLFESKNSSKNKNKENIDVKSLTEHKGVRHPVIKATSNQVRICIMRYIYEVLKDPKYNSEIIKDQRELSLNQVNYIADILRDIIVNQEIREEWLNNLQEVRRINLEKGYEKLQAWLRKKKVYRENFLNFFHDSIEFIFELIIGKHKISELSGFRLKIAEDLKKNYGFTANTRQRNVFEIYITIFASRYIYKAIKSPDFAMVLGGIQDELTASQIEKLAHALRKSIALHQIKNEWLDEFKKLRKKEFMKKYEKLLNYLKSDQIYSESFLDHLRQLIEYIFGLVKGTSEISEAKGIKREIAYDLKNKIFLLNNNSLSSVFKLNLSIVLCRLIYLILNSLISDGKLKKDNYENINTTLNGVLISLKRNLMSKKKIKNDLLEKLYYINRKDFDREYEKLHSLLIADQVYREGFLEWIERQIKFVFNLVLVKDSKSKYSKLEHIIIKDLMNYSFGDDNFINGNSRNVLYDTEKRIFIEPSEVQLIFNELKTLGIPRGRILKIINKYKDEDESFTSKLEKILIEMDTIKFISQKEFGELIGCRFDYVIRQEATISLDTLKRLEWLINRKIPYREKIWRRQKRALVNPVQIRPIYDILKNEGVLRERIVKIIEDFKDKDEEFTKKLELILKEVDSKRFSSRFEIGELLDLDFGKILYPQRKVKHANIKKITVDEKTLRRLELLIGRKITHKILLGQHEELSIEEDENLAEMIGIILGDGSIYDSNGKYALRIALNNKHDIRYIDYVKNLMHSVFNAEPSIKPNKKKSATYLNLWRKNVVKFLIDKGLRAGDKVENQVQVPEWIKNSPTFIVSCTRGLVDTDGWIGVDKSKKMIEIKFFSSAFPLVSDFKEMCNSLEIYTGKITGSWRYSRKSKKLVREFSVAIHSKKDVSKFIDIIKPIKWKFRFNIIGMLLMALNDKRKWKKIKKSLKQKYPDNKTHWHKNYENYLKNLCKEQGHKITIERIKETIRQTLEYKRHKI